MKIFFATLLLALFALTTVSEASVIGGKPFQQIIHISAATDTSTESAANDGRDYASAKGFFDGDLFAIPANVIIENIYVVVDQTVSGITAFNLGDDDSSTGFVASSSPTFTANSKYFWEVDYKGSYLKGGATLTASVNSKYYAATGKEVKLDVTGTASAGKMRVIITGYAPGKSE